VAVYSGPDHIHLLLSVPPSISLSKVVQHIKGKSSRKILQEFEVLRKKYWGQHLIFCSYCWKRELRGRSAIYRTTRNAS
jgi:REP element-mobilizing transposase RayT